MTVFSKFSTFTVAGETREWPVQKGATALELYAQIQLEDEKKLFQLWKMEREPALLDHGDSLDGLEHISFLIFYIDDMETVNKCVREAIKVKTEAAVEEVDVKNLQKTAELVADAFMLKQSKRMMKRDDHGCRVLEECEKGARVYIEHEFAEALNAVQDREALFKALVKMESAIRVYMSVNLVKSLRRSGLETMTERMNLMQQMIVKVKAIKTIMNDLLGTAVRGDSDSDDEDVEEDGDFKNAIKLLTEAVHLDDTEEFIRVVKEVLGDKRPTDILAELEKLLVY